MQKEDLSSDESVIVADSPDDIFQEIQALSKESSASETTLHRIIALAGFALSHFDAILNDHARGMLYFQSALAHGKLINHAAQLAEARMAADYFHRSGDSIYESKSYHECGLAAWHTGKFPEALEMFAIDLEICHSIDNKRGESITLNNLGSVYRNLGDFSASLEYYEKSLKIKEEIEDMLGIANVIGNIGALYHQKGDIPSALEYYRRSLELKEQLGDKRLSALTLSNIGNAYSQLGDKEQALETLFRALALTREVGMPSTEASLLGHIGDTYARFGLFEDAFTFLQNALAMVNELGYNNRRHVVLSQLSELFQRPEYDGFNPETARSYLMQALDLALEGKEILHVAKYYLRLSNIEREAGHLTPAIEYLHLHIDYDKQVNTKAAEEKLQALQVQHKVEQLRKEAQIERLRNIELAEANNRLEILNKEKNEFLGIAAHDLKNPLGAIKLASDFLNSHADSLSPEDIRELSGDILRTSSYMFSIISNLLDINALESGKITVTLAPCDVTELVRFVTDNYRQRAANKSIELLCISPNSPITALADPHRLREVLENLVSNAIKFSPQHRSIEVDVSTVQNSHDKTVVQISVRDHGPGISPDDMKKLFGKFQKLHARPTDGEDSTGLGLSIVKKLVELMDGNVWCESILGDGATFFVELPAAAPDITSR